MEYSVLHYPERNRFEIHESDLVAYLDYQEKPGVINILHVVVPKPLEGKGLASSLMKGALNYVESKKLKVIATCPFAKAYFERNSQYKYLLL